MSRASLSTSLRAGPRAARGCAVRRRPQRRRYRMQPQIRHGRLVLLVAGAVALALFHGSGTSPGRAQEPGPTLVDPNLGVRAVVSGLTTPITMAFLGPEDFLVLEKNTGKVKRVLNGAVHSVVLDLSVNFGSERGLLGIALHPSF